MRPRGGPRPRRRDRRRGGRWPCRAGGPAPSAGGAARGWSGCCARAPRGRGWPRSARARRPGRAGSVARGAAAAEHHVEVAAEAVLVEERPLGGVGRLEPLAGGAADPPAADDLLLGRQHLGVGGVERGPLGGRDGRRRGRGVEGGEGGRRRPPRGGGRRRARPRWRPGSGPPTCAQVGVEVAPGLEPAPRHRGRPRRGSTRPGARRAAARTAATSGASPSRRPARRAGRPRGAPRARWPRAGAPRAWPGRRRAPPRHRCTAWPAASSSRRRPLSSMPEPASSASSRSASSIAAAAAVRCSRTRSRSCWRGPLLGPALVEGVAHGLDGGEVLRQVGVELRRPRRRRRRSCAASPGGARAGGGRCRSRASCGRPRRRGGRAAALRSSARSWANTSAACQRSSERTSGDGRPGADGPQIAGDDLGQPGAVGRVRERDGEPLVQAARSGVGGRLVRHGRWSRRIEPHGTPRAVADGPFWWVISAGE